MNILELPTEILEIILNFLDYKTLSKIICKRLYEIQFGILIKNKIFNFNKIPNQYYYQIRKLKVKLNNNIDLTQFINLKKT